MEWKDEQNSLTDKGIGDLEDSGFLLQDGRPKIIFSNSLLQSSFLSPFDLDIYNGCLTLSFTSFGKHNAFAGGR